MMYGGSTMRNNLFIFTAHLDDLEFSCLGYLLKHTEDYNTINVVIASTWEDKVHVWKDNLKLLENKIGKKINYFNLGFEQRTIPTNFDKVKDSFYKIVNFEERFDILTHDKNDAHTDHRALYEISFGLYKYSDRFITLYSPEAVDFIPNYYVDMTESDDKFKKNLISNYDFGKEQTYTKKGSYFELDYQDIPSIYAKANFHNAKISHCEMYKIYKWI